MKQKIILLLVVLSISLMLNAQGIKEMQIRQIEPPNVRELFLSNPEDGGMVIYTRIPHLTFDSNMNSIVKIDEMPLDGKYKLYLKAMPNQIIIIKSLGFVECHVHIKNLKAQEGRYYILEEVFEDSNIGIGNLSLITDPPGAKINIQGVPHGEIQTPYIFEGLATNTYRITFNKDRYQEKEIIVKVERDKKNERNIKLDPNWADLTLSSEPNNCRVYIDGEYVGYTPLSYTGLERGFDPKRYNVRIEKPNEYYIDRIKSLDLKAMDNINEHFVLEDISGYISFVQTDKNYNVYINNNLKGRQSNNTNLRLVQGQYSLRCEVSDSDAEFYAPWETTVNLNAQDNINIKPYFKSEFANLTLRTNISPIEVFLNNKKHNALTNRLNAKVFPKTYTVTVKKTGDKAYAYSQWQEKINLKDNENKFLDVYLEPIKANLSLNSNNPQTEYSIFDNDLNKIVAKGRSKQHELLIGSYEITATAKGYLPLTRNINLKANRYEKVNFSLQTYQGSLQQKKRFWQYNMYAGLALTALNGAAIYYSWDQYNGFYDKYLVSQSNANAIANRDKTTQWQDINQISQFSIVVPVSYSVYSLYKAWTISKSMND